MTDGLVPEMQGSPNPLILRNYRMIPPQTWKYFNLSPMVNAFQGQHVYQRDINLVFKVDAAPVVLPYESELVLKFTFLTNKNEYDDIVSNQWAPNPLYRIKAKSIAHIVKRCWATISNMTFQSYRPPFYLNEILLRKPAYNQKKYPDNYTGEKIGYFSVDGVIGDNSKLDDFAPNVVHVLDPGTVFHISNAYNGEEYSRFLQPLSRTVPNDDQLYFMSPQFESTTKKFLNNDGEMIDLTINYLTFRIPFTELLPVFKIGVIPLILIASNSFDMWIDLYNPSDWFYNLGLGEISALETYLNVTTVSFPDINPLAEMLIKPRIYEGRFIAPYLDYLSFEQTYNINRHETQFFFNITQFLRNVPFISVTFSDMSEYRNVSFTMSRETPFVDDTNITGYIANEGVGDQQEENAHNPDNQILALMTNTNFVTGPPDLLHITSEQAVRGGFFSLPPNVRCEDLKILLGESAYPLTQVPMSWDDMYMYNRKHFEMYGRDFNINRVSPVGRAYSGDASFFFDLSHSPMTGFEIGPKSPLQVMGKIVSNDMEEEDGDIYKPHQIHVTLTCYYSNNFNVMLASGGTLPLQ